MICPPQKKTGRFHPIFPFLSSLQVIVQSLKNLDVGSTQCQGWGECCSLLLMEHKLHLHLINTEKSDFSSPKKRKRKKGSWFSDNKGSHFFGGRNFPAVSFNTLGQLNIDIQRGVFDESGEADDKISTILLKNRCFKRLTTGILDFVHQWKKMFFLCYSEFHLPPIWGLANRWFDVSCLGSGFWIMSQVRISKASTMLWKLENI